MNLQELFDKHADNIEKMGFTPVSSRILIYLYAKGNEGTEFDEIVTELHVSKSAVSNALKVLETMNFITSKTINLSGKRKFYLGFCELITETELIDKHRAMIEVLEDIIIYRNSNDESTQTLNNIILLHKMLIQELPAVFEKWKEIIAEQNN